MCSLQANLENKCKNFLTMRKHVWCFSLPLLDWPVLWYRWIYQLIWCRSTGWMYLMHIKSFDTDAFINWSIPYCHIELETQQILVPELLISHMVFSACFWRIHQIRGEFICEDKAKRTFWGWFLHWLHCLKASDLSFLQDRIASCLYVYNVIPRHKSLLEH